MSWQRALVNRTLKRFPFLLKDPNAAVPTEVMMDRFAMNVLQDWRDRALSPVIFVEWLVGQIARRLGAGPDIEASADVIASELNLDHLCSIGQEWLFLAVAARRTPGVAEKQSELEHTKLARHLMIVDHCCRCAACFSAMHYIRLVQLIKSVHLTIPKLLRASDNADPTKEQLARLTDADVHWIEHLTNELRRLPAPEMPAAEYPSN